MPIGAEKILKKPDVGETDFYADTMEHEKKTEAFTDINRDKGIFANKFATGLNCDEGIFDKTAIFKTK